MGQSLRELFQERHAALQVRCRCREVLEVFRCCCWLRVVFSAVVRLTIVYRYTTGVSQGLLYEPDTGPKASIVAGVNTLTHIAQWATCLAELHPHNIFPFLTGPRISCKVFGLQLADGAFRLPRPLELSRNQLRRRPQRFTRRRNAGAGLHSLNSFLRLYFYVTLG